VEIRPLIDPLAALTDAALVARVGEGDDHAFATLDRRHRDRLLRHCRSVLGNADDAEEAVQGAMLKAFRAMSRGARPDSVLPWLLTICTNECRDLVRRRRTTSELPDALIAGGEEPHERAERRERLTTLRRDLEELPERQRRAFVLRRFADLPPAEVARRMGGSSAGVQTLVHEAHASLAEFEAGRSIPCATVRERIDGGDGRALRARRLRAHLRQCAACRDRAARLAPAVRGRRVAALLPLPAFVAAARALFKTGGMLAVGAAGTSATAVVAVVVSFSGVAGADGPDAVDAGGWRSAPPSRASHAIASPGRAQTQATTNPSEATGPFMGLLPTRDGTPAMPIAGGGVTPGASSAPGASTSEPDPAAAAPSAPAAGGAATGARGRLGPVVEKVPVPDPPLVPPQISLPPPPVTPAVTIPPVAVPPVEVGGVEAGPVVVPPVSVPPVVVPPVPVPSVQLPGVAPTP